MKMPWTKSIETISTKMQNTFDRISKVILEQDKLTHEKSMDQLSIFKRSEQIKYNRLLTRVVDLESMLEAELKHYKKNLELQEISAATDSEKATL